jgi:hypothetical protein
VLVEAAFFVLTGKLPFKEVVLRSGGHDIAVEQGELSVHPGELKS